MRDVKQDSDSPDDRNKDDARQLLESTGEPAPVDLVRFRKRVGEIIAQAMQAFRMRRQGPN
jgi:hypothetical protein